MLPSYKTGCFGRSQNLARSSQEQVVLGGAFPPTSHFCRSCVPVKRADVSNNPCETLLHYIVCSRPCLNDLLQPPSKREQGRSLSAQPIFGPVFGLLWNFFPTCVGCVLDATFDLLRYRHAGRHTILGHGAEFQVARQQVLLASCAMLAGCDKVSRTSVKKARNFHMFHMLRHALFSRILREKSLGNA